MTKNWLKRLLTPAVMGLGAVTILSGCVAEVEIRRGRVYSDRIWYSDPYCYGRGYGCRGYYGWRGSRIRYIEHRRWDRGWSRRGDYYRRGGGGGWHRGGGRGRHRLMAEAMPLSPETQARVTWQEEFNLSTSSVNYIRNSFKQALRGNLAPLNAVGFSKGDIARMTKFRLPADGSIAAAAGALKVNFEDLKDFMEVFMLRMQDAYSNNEPF